MSNKSERKRLRKQKMLEAEDPWRCFCEEYDVDKSWTLWSDDWIHPTYGNLGRQPYHQCNLCHKIRYCGAVMA